MMMRTSKSPKAVAQVAYKVAQQTFPPYRHLKSPQKFTQPQLITCLVLREFFKTDYRGVVEIMRDSTDLQHTIELQETPHCTTLQKAAQRFTDKRSMDKLVGAILKHAIAVRIMKQRVVLAAVDSTGFESRHTSRYFVYRKAKGGVHHQTTHYTRFPKIGLAVDCASYLVLAGVTSWGPSPDVIYIGSK